MERFGESFKQFRLRQGMKQRELAKALGIHQHTISAWERGLYVPVTPERIIQITKALGIINEEETDQLLVAAHHPPQYGPQGAQITSLIPSPLSNQTDKPIFISYSRANTDFARNLYSKLKGLGFKLWRDRSEMEAGKDWWQQIQAAILSATSVVLVLSPSAMASAVVRKEWLYARQVGTRVIPVIAEGIDFQVVPSWMKRLDLLDLRPDAPERALSWDRFISQLSSPYEPVRVPFMVPDLPEHFVERSAELQELLGLYLDEARENPVAITVALIGGGGFGKTTLAQELGFHPEIQAAFSDGILWVQMGEEPDTLNLLLDQIELLSGHRPGLSDVNAAASRLDEVISEREILLILDDVWTEKDALPFLGRGKFCAKLITTRRQDIATRLASHLLLVGEMEAEQATQLLINWLPVSPSEITTIRKLVVALGYWPLLISLTRAYLRELVMLDGYSLEDALTEIQKRLEYKGFAGFDQVDENQRNRAISISIEVSLDRLGGLRERYLELTTLSPDAAIPFETIAQLWYATAGLDQQETEDILRDMSRLSLFVFYDISTRTLMLHDVIRSYLLSQVIGAPLIHQQLLKEWTDPYALPDAYAWRNYAYHLIHAHNLAQLYTVNAIIRVTHPQNK